MPLRIKFSFLLLFALLGNGLWGQNSTSSLQELKIRFDDQNSSKYDVLECELTQGYMDEQKILLEDAGQAGRATTLTLQSLPQASTILRLDLQTTDATYQISLENGVLKNENGVVLYDGPLAIGDLFYIGADGDYIQYGLNDQILATIRTTRSELALATTFSWAHFPGGELSFSLVEKEINPIPMLTFAIPQQTLSPGEPFNICLDLDFPNLSSEDLVVPIDLMTSGFPHFIEFGMPVVRIPPGAQSACLEGQVPLVGWPQVQRYTFTLRESTNQAYTLGTPETHQISITSSDDSPPVALEFIGFDNQVGGPMYPEADKLVLFAKEKLSPAAIFYLVKGDTTSAGNWSTEELAVQKIQYIGADTIPAGTILCFDIPAPGAMVDELAHCFVLDGSATLGFTIEEAYADGMSSINMIAGQAEDLYIVQGDWTFGANTATLEGQEVAALSLSAAAGSQYSYLECPETGQLDYTYITVQIEQGAAIAAQTGTNANDLPWDVCQPDCQSQLEEPLPPEWTMLPQDLILSCSQINIDQQIMQWLTNNGQGMVVSASCSEGGITIINDYNSVTSALCQDGEQIVHFLATDDCGGEAFASAKIIYDNQPPQFLSEAQDTLVGCLPLLDLFVLFESWKARQANALTSKDCNISWNAYFNWENTCSPESILSFADVVFIGTDYCGNEISTSARFQIDAQAGDFAIANPQILNLAIDDPQKQEKAERWLANHADVDLSNNCSIPINWSHDFDLEMLDNCGTYVLNFSANTTCGQSAAFSTTLTIEDNTPPVFEQAPGDITISCPMSPFDQSLLQFWLNEGFGGAVVSDNNDGILTKRVIRNPIDQNGNPACSSEEVIFEVSDGCGNVARDTANIIRSDNEAPILALDTILAPQVLGDTACGQYLLPIHLNLSDDCFGGAAILAERLNVDLVVEDSSLAYTPWDTLILGEVPDAIQLLIQVPLGAATLSLSVSDYCGNTTALEVPIAIFDPQLQCTASFQVPDTLLLSRSDTNLLEQIIHWQENLMTQDLPVIYECPDSVQVDTSYIQFDSLTILGTDSLPISSENFSLANDCGIEVHQLQLLASDSCLQGISGEAFIKIIDTTYLQLELADVLQIPNDTTIEESQLSNVESEWLSRVQIKSVDCLYQDSLSINTQENCTPEQAQYTIDYAVFASFSQGIKFTDTFTITVIKGPLSITNPAEYVAVDYSVVGDSWGNQYNSWRNSFGGFTVDEDCRQIEYSIQSTRVLNCPRAYQVIFRAKDKVTGHVVNSHATFTINGFDEINTPYSFIPPQNKLVSYYGNNASQIEYDYHFWLFNDGGGKAIYVNSCGYFERPLVVQEVNHYPCDPTDPNPFGAGVYEVTFGYGNDSQVATFTIEDKIPPSLEASVINAATEAEWLASNGGLIAEDNCPNPSIQNRFISRDSNCLDYFATYQFWAADASGNLSDTLELTFSHTSLSSEITLADTTLDIRVVERGDSLTLSELENAMYSGIEVNPATAFITRRSDPTAISIVDLFNNAAMDTTILYKVWGVDTCGVSSDTLELALQLTNIAPEITLSGSNVISQEIECGEIISPSELENAMYTGIEVNGDTTEITLMSSPTAASIASQINGSSVDQTIDYQVWAYHISGASSDTLQMTYQVSYAVPTINLSGPNSITTSLDCNQSLSTEEINNIIFANISTPANHTIFSNPTAIEIASTISGINDDQTIDYEVWAQDVCGNTSQIIALQWNLQIENTVPVLSRKPGPNALSYGDCKGSVSESYLRFDLLRAVQVSDDAGDSHTYEFSPSLSSIVDNFNEGDLSDEVQVRVVDGCGERSNWLNIPIYFTDIDNGFPNNIIPFSYAVDICNNGNGDIAALEAIWNSASTVNGTCKTYELLGEFPEAELISAIDGCASSHQINFTFEEISTGEIVSRTLSVQIGRCEVYDTYTISGDASTGVLTRNGAPTSCSGLTTTWFRDGQWIGIGSSITITTGGSFQARTTCSNEPCTDYYSNTIQFEPPSCPGSTSITTLSSRPPGNYTGPAPSNYFALRGTYNISSASCPDGELELTWFISSGQQPVSSSEDGSIIEFNGMPNGTYTFGVRCREPDGQVGCTFSSSWSNNIGTIAAIPAPTGFTVADQRYKLYPNPSQNEAFLDFYLDWDVPINEKIKIRFFDKTGKLVQQMNPETRPGLNHLTLNTSDLVSGVYFVGIQLAGKVKMKKLVIMK
ncbi:MAG: hypothetical protein Sapg2KO_47830 [Saprospiraceae bacterium]